MHVNDIFRKNVINIKSQKKQAFTFPLENKVLKDHRFFCSVTRKTTH